MQKDQEKWKPVEKSEKSEDRTVLQQTKCCLGKGSNILEGIQ